MAPFMLRVKCACHDEETMTTILDTLKVCASFQGPHKGVVTYHFSHPDPEARPYYIEFTEVYANEESFWAHSMHQEMMEAFAKGFSAEVLAKTETVTYGFDVPEGKVKETCTLLLKCQYPPTSSQAGFVLNSEKWSLDKEEGDGPILMFIYVDTKPSKAKEVLHCLGAVADSSNINAGVLTSFCSVTEPEKQPNHVDFMELCSSNAKLQEHFSQAAVKEALSCILQNSESVSCVAFGTLLSKTTDTLKSVGLTCNFRTTDVGYVLHPEADPNCKV